MIRCCGRERTKAITVFLYPPVMHRGNGWVSYILGGWCHFPFVSLSLFLSLLASHYSLLFFMLIYKIIKVIMMISRDWHGFAPQRDAGPCHTPLPAADGWGDFSPTEEWGEVQSPFWVPPHSGITLGKQRGHLWATFSPVLCEASSAPLV